MGQGDTYNVCCKGRGFARQRPEELFQSEVCTQRHKTQAKEFVKRGFPGGAVVKNPPANAGDMGSKPRSGKIPHATEQLSLCTTTTEPAL